MSTHLSTADTADRLDVPLRTVQRACRAYLDSDGARGLRCVEVGGRLRVPTSTLEGWGSADPGRLAADDLGSRIAALEREVSSQAEIAAELAAYLNAYRGLVSHLPEPRDASRSATAAARGRFGTEPSGSR